MKTLLLILSFAIVIPNLATAKRVGGLFGKNEKIEKIQDLDVQGPNEEELYLAYKTSEVFFFLGVYFSDDGYVIGIKGQRGSYYPLDEAKIAELQEVGQLPSPLPEYKISLYDRLFGFSLWILIAFTLAVAVFPTGKRTAPRLEQAPT